MAVIGFAVHAQGKVEQLSAQNQQLRHANAAVKRAQTLPAGGGINQQAIPNACYVYPMPPTLLAAIRLQENGPEGLELGNHGKTKFICDTFPLEEWQYAEAARTSTKFAWEFCMAPKNRKVFLTYLASRYTGPPATKYFCWARSVDKLEKKVAKR